MSNFPNFGDDEREKAMLSRAQAGLAIIFLSKASVEDSVNAITDDFKDSGIDAIYADKINKTLFLCQSKWISNGKNVPKKKEIQSFLKGVDDLIKLKITCWLEFIIRYHYSSRFQRGKKSVSLEAR